MRLLGYLAVKLLGYWRLMDLADFQKHLLFSLRPHITDPLFAFHADPRTPPLLLHIRAISAPLPYGSLHSSGVLDAYR